METVLHYLCNVPVGASLTDRNTFKLFKTFYLRFDTFAKISPGRANKIHFSTLLLVSRPPMP